MTLVETLRVGLERLLEWIVIALVAGLTLIVVCGFVFRYLGFPLVWYDELASIGLVWLTYYGSALAASKGAHIGVPELVNAMKPSLRVPVTLFAEACVIVLFVMLAITGWEVLEVLGNDRMISLRSVPLRLTQSAVPVGAVLVILAELLRLPRRLQDARGAGFVDPELKEALDHIGLVTHAEDKRA